MDIPSGLSPTFSQKAESEDDFLGYGFVSISEAVLFTPLCVGSRTTLVELGVLIMENHAYVEVGPLLFNQQMFVSVFNSPPALRLNVKKAALFGQLEIWCVGR